MNYYEQTLQTHLRQRAAIQEREQQRLANAIVKAERARHPSRLNFAFLRGLLPHRQERARCSASHELA